MAKPTKQRWMPLAALVLLVLALGWEWLGRPASTPAREEAPPPPVAARSSAPPAPLRVGVVLPEPEDPFAGLRGSPRPHPVDLERLRAELPGNLYWEEGVPTEDEAALRARADRSRARKDAAARIQANEATPAEIDAYYAERERLSRDFAAFAARVLELHGETLPEQERGLYALTIQLHRARLDELPRQREEALARYAEAERRRAQWRERGATP